MAMSEGWARSLEDFKKPIMECVGDLGDKLSDIDNIDVYSFDEYVKYNIGSGKPLPKTVDCIHINDRTISLIEFKKMPNYENDDAVEEVRSKMYDKAKDTIHLLSKFIEDLSEYDLKLFYVTDSPAVSAVSTAKNGLHSVKKLQKYCTKDIYGEPVYYDTIKEMGCNFFVNCINRSRFFNKRFGLD